MVDRRAPFAVVVIVSYIIACSFDVDVRLSEMKRNLIEFIYIYIYFICKCVKIYKYIGFPFCMCVLGVWFLWYRTDIILCVCHYFFFIFFFFPISIFCRRFFFWFFFRNRLRHSKTNRFASYQQMTNRCTSFTFLFLSVLPLPLSFLLLHLLFSRPSWIPEKGVRSSIRRFDLIISFCMVQC